MKAFVASVPLFDSGLIVQAYSLCERSGDSVLDIAKGHSRMTNVFDSPGLDLIARLGPEPFAADVPLFVEVNRFQLLTGTPVKFNISPEKLVCVLPSDLPHEDSIVERLTSLQQAGYKLAYNGIPDEGLANPLLQFFSYVVLDYDSHLFATHYSGVKEGIPEVDIVVSGVPSMEVFTDLAAKNPRALFTGFFYNQPITQEVGEISPIKVNALHLMRQVNEEDFDLLDVIKIIERDPSLSISLMRFINSAAVKLERRVSSIGAAVAILGQQEIRRWAMVAISVGLGEDRPVEITRISLIRAKFAENLAGIFNLGVFQHVLFMIGLFSLLDVILQKPMSEAIKEVAVNEEVGKTLVGRSGKFFPVMQLIYAYEHAEWDEANRIMIQNSVDLESVSGAFVDAIIWYDQLLKAIDDTDETGDAEPETLSE